MKAPNDFIQDTCNRTEDFKDLCISVIDSDPREDLKLNSMDFLVIFINRTLQVIIDDHSYLLNQTLNEELDNRTRHIFMGCMTLYQMSKDSLRVLLNEELLKQPNADLNMKLQQIEGYLDLCQNDFEGFTPTPSTWTSRYDYVISLLILSFRMMNLIKCNYIRAC
ncbi:hypothetical protein SDJN03_08814, partial [Cucurbita argyrosperma subsp. sororia]